VVGQAGASASNFTISFSSNPSKSSLVLFAKEKKALKNQLFKQKAKEI